jgi:hypothetical protein
MTGTATLGAAIARATAVQSEELATAWRLLERADEALADRAEALATIAAELPGLLDGWLTEAGLGERDRGPVIDAVAAYLCGGGGTR